MRQLSINTLQGTLLLLTTLLTQVSYATEDNTIVVFGASGRIGDVIVLEALARNYKVLGVSRNPGKLLLKHPGFSPVKGDLTNIDSVRELARGAKAFVISITAKSPDNTLGNSLLVKATNTVHAALEGLENKPYIVQVGGANLMYGSIYEELKENMLDAPFNFDKGSEMYAVLLGHQLSVQIYRAGPLDWTVAAPPIKILGIYGKPDKTTTRASFRLSTEGPIVDEEGNKMIYVRDLAKAVVDEIENRHYVGQIFTMAY